MSSGNTSDWAQLVRAVQEWAFWRDSGDWDSLLHAFAPDGKIATSWSTLDAQAFVDACRSNMLQTPYEVMHSIGGSSVAVVGDKAVVETQMTLLLRGTVHGQEVDVTSHGCTYDRFIRTPVGWKISVRANIYKKSRMDPTEPGRPLPLDQARLLAYPRAYRHLAYFQTLNGAKVPTDLPTPGSPVHARLKDECRVWLHSAEHLGTQSTTSQA